MTSAVATFRWTSYLRSSILVLTSSVVGDFGCQALLHRNQETNETTTPNKAPVPFLDVWDQKRTTIMGINAFFVMSPMIYTIQFWLEKKFPGKALITILKKMAINISVSPLTMAITFASVNFMKGRNTEEVKQKIENDLFPTLLAGGLYWPFVQFFNFRFVPFDYRPFVGSLAGAIWNIFVSNQTNKPVGSPLNNVDVTDTIAV